MNEPVDPTASRLDPREVKPVTLSGTPTDPIDPNSMPSPLETIEQAQEAIQLSGWPMIPGFEIEQEVGRGGMGVVYKARQTGLNRVVALKMILNTSHAAPGTVARFLNEAEAVARIDHPNIVPIYQSGRLGEHPYFALEFVDGGTLQDRIRKNTVRPQDAARIVEQLSRGMAVSHEKGIVHRDLKPLNVLMTKDGIPKITDFGLAKRLEAGDGLTQTGAILGTPSYMAPEQARGETDKISPSTDIHALGAILYALLTGRPPFVGPSSHATMQQVMLNDPVGPRNFQPGIPRDLETICLKCLRKEPSDRYPSAQSLADDLLAFREGRGISARPLGRFEKAARWARKNPGWLVMISLLFVTMSLGTAISLHYAAQARKNRSSDAPLVDPGTAPESLRFGVIELTSRSVNSFVVRPYADGERFAFETIKQFDPIPIPSGKLFVDGKLLDPSDLEQVRAAVKVLYQEMRSDSYGLPVDRIAIVRSSGVVRGLRDVETMMANGKSLQQVVQETTGSKLDCFSPEREAKYTSTFLSPRPKQRENSLLIDIGPDEIKGGFYTPDGIFFGTDVDTGSSRFARAVSEAVQRTKGDYESTARSLSRVMIYDKLMRDLANNPGLGSKSNVYLSGGLARMLRTYTHPNESLNKMVVELEAEDIRKYRELVSLNNPERIVEAVLGEVKDDARKLLVRPELDRLQKMFTHDQQRAGAEILTCLADAYRFDKKQLQFYSQGEFAPTMGYVLLRLGLAR